MDYIVNKRLFSITEMNRSVKKESRKCTLQTELAQWQT